jgi:hypothetical protein
MALLAKRQEALQLAMRQGRENSVDRPIGSWKQPSVTSSALWRRWRTRRRGQERLQEICEPVETLIRLARATRLDTAGVAWVTQVRTLTNPVVESARQMNDDHSTDYTPDEVDEELQLMTKHRQRLRELLTAGK